MRASLGMLLTAYKVRPEKCARTPPARYQPTQGPGSQGKNQEFWGFYLQLKTYN
jgi:hypothetical protein